MAGATLCGACAEAEAEVLVISLAGAPSLDFCMPCFALAGLGIAKAILPAEVIADTLGPMFVKAPPEAQEGRQKPRPGKRTPEPAPPPQGPPEPAQGLSEAQTATSDG